MAPYPSTPVILREDADGVAVLSINRPEALNAMNREVLDELSTQLSQIAQDDTVDVLVFTGTGTKSFVAGADINELAQRTPVDGLAARMQSVFGQIAASAKPTIAAVNGFAFGGGHEFALACDIRICSDNAQFALPETGLGIIPAAGGTQRLVRLIGMGRAIDMMLTGRRVDARTALTAGLVTEVTDPESLMDAAHRIAQRIRAKGPLAIRLVKSVVNHGMDASMETGLLLETLAQSLLYSTDEKAEGTQAFIDKRKPDFRAATRTS
ncbi:enoyl-CoA hydratase/isomerase family protein [Streptomyces diacarni]|uniref:enoyl-CoA hydratase/isomerase family protein n=1 Tax=Actinomycetes TaxID=1760 RepID=UPI0033E31042